MLRVLAEGQFLSFVALKIPHRRRRTLSSWVRQSAASQSRASSSGLFTDPLVRLSCVEVVMFAALCADGLPIASDGETESVTLELGIGAGTLWRCRACGEDLTETTAGWATEAADGLVCAAYDRPDPTRTSSSAGCRRATARRWPTRRCPAASCT
jgi:hypothetical protein